MRAVCSNGVALRIGHCNPAPFQLDGHLLGDRIAAIERRVDRQFGHLEVLQVHPISRHPCASQCGLHDVHERARTADVVLGVIGVRNEGFDVRRCHEAIFVVEMMLYDETVRVRVVQGYQRFVEDHRVTAAVGVEQPGVSRSGDSSADRSNENTGVMPLPPANATSSRSVSFRTKRPWGGKA